MVGGVCHTILQCTDVYVHGLSCITWIMYLLREVSRSGLSGNAKSKSLIFISIYASFLPVQRGISTSCLIAVLLLSPIARRHPRPIRPSPNRPLHPAAQALQIVGMPLQLLDLIPSA